MERKILTEELGRMSYLFGHKRGVVISEQPGQLVGKSNDSKMSGVDVSTDAPNWKKSSSGKISMSNFSKDDTGVIVNATNVSYKNEIYNLLVTKGIAKNLPYTYEKTKETTTPPQFSEFEFIDQTFPFDDNMITTKKGNKDFENLLKLVENTIVNNIKKGGLGSIKNIKITGFADSARPTTDVPKGYSGLDHDKALDENLKKMGCKNYCDIDKNNKDERNKFLALQRARNMAAILNKRVNSAFTVVSSEEFKNPNKNVEDFRKSGGLPLKLFIIDSFAAPVTDSVTRTGKRSVTIDVIPSDPITTPGSTTTEKEYITVAPTPKQGTIEYEGVTLSISEVITKEGYSLFVVDNDEALKGLVKGGKIPNLSISGKMNGKSEVNGSINGDNITIDGLDWGSFVEYGSSESGVESGSFMRMRWITEKSVLCATEINDNDGYAVLVTYRIVLAEPQNKPY